ncbi:DUF4199 domain-containing protein [Pedobacter psychrodurus]|uniref:DUF4199 domain-containing protein n=1 Tax=Pedobacter psychrodurus TaxID=2530456 RepID=UPI00292F54E1|nr:DUF4199 domain-containing protein [Pedobacter psychrodurus]
MEQQILQEEKKPNALAFKVALGFSLYTLAMIYVFKLIGIDTTSADIPIVTKVIVFVLSYGIFILAIYFTQATHKKELGDYITFGRAFSTGFKVAAYSGLFIGILYAIYFKILDPSAIDKIANAAIEKAGDNEQQIKGIDMMKPYMWIFATFTAAISYTIFGLIVSLITGAVIKKERV